MGFSTSGAAAIVFVGLLVATGIAYPALETAHDRRTGAIEERDQRALDVRNTEINVTQAAYDSADEELVVNVTNAGSTALSVNETDVLTDGTYLEADEYETAVDGDAGREVWLPGETLTIAIDATEEPDRAKIVTENGVAETVLDVEVI